MPKILRAGRKGAVEVEVTEEELAAMSQVNASTPPPPAHVEELAESDDDVLDLIGDPDKIVVVEKTVTVAKQEKPVFIKRLSRRENDNLANKKQRRDFGTGKITLVEDADLTVLAWQLHLCVVKNIAKPAEEPIYIPRWPIEQIIGKNAVVDEKTGKITQIGKGGLLDNPSSEAESLIDQLQVHIWDVNPSGSPLVMAQALQSLGML